MSISGKYVKKNKTDGILLFYFSNEEAFGQNKL